jgi:signal peptidase II
MRAVPKSRYFVFFTIAAAGCLVDLATKSCVFAWLSNRRQPYWVVPNLFGFQTNLNEGALFGMGQGMVVLFAVLSVAAAVGILYWLFMAKAARDLLLTVALACVMAGILGNLYDRVGLPGLTWQGSSPLHAAGDPVYAVRDWILVIIVRYHWPTFNIADSLLVCGAGMLIWHAFRRGKHEPQDEAA